MMKKTTNCRNRQKNHNPHGDCPHTPLVLCLTNTVAANFTANVLLAVGAKPAMVEDPDEAAELAAVADAVLVNVGTLTAAQSEVMLAAVESCRVHDTPWVLDPVAVQALAYRRAFVAELLAQHPTLIRGNVEEIRYLRTHFDHSLGSVPTLATGAVDEITWGQSPQKWGQSPNELGQTPNEWGQAPNVEALKKGGLSLKDGGQTLRVEGGVPMLQAVTATGCAQGAVCAAYLGGLSPFDMRGLSPVDVRGQSPVDLRGLSPVVAAVSASLLMKRAGEIAWERAKTPGAFQMALLDALCELTHDKRRNNNGLT